VHLLLQIVSVLRICLTFLHTSARLGSAVPGREEKICTRSSGGRSSSDCGCGGPAESAEPQSPPAPLGPAPRLFWQLLPLGSSFILPTTLSSSSSSSMSTSESLFWSWLCLCRLRHRRDWPTPQSLAHTAICSNITSSPHNHCCQSSVLHSSSGTCVRVRVPGRLHVTHSRCTLHCCRDWLQRGQVSKNIYINQKKKKKDLNIKARFKSNDTCMY